MLLTTLLPDVPELKKLKNAGPVSIKDSFPPVLSYSMKRQVYHLVDIGGNQELSLSCSRRCGCVGFVA